eukprot:COSAG06_NODE_42138_length_384_cov_1.073684_1_plen_36_part_10
MLTFKRYSKVFMFTASQTVPHHTHSAIASTRAIRKD